MGGGSVHDEACVNRFVINAAVGLFTGAFYGAVESAYAGGPAGVRTKLKIDPWKQPRIRAITFAAGAASFAGAECGVNSLIGRPSWEGCVAGGAAAGSVIGLVKGSPVVGVAAGISIALFSIAYEESEASNMWQNGRASVHKGN